MPPGSLVYVLTDEKDPAFFDPVRGRYHLRFLSDFLERLKETTPVENLNHLGMIEQAIATGADTFVGTWWSTLSGYITRMRGYASRDPGYYYYTAASAPLKSTHSMHE